MSIRVKAVFPNGGFGWNGRGRLRDGDEFTIEDESQFSEIWMERIEEEKAPPKKASRKKRAAKGESEEKSEE